MAEGWRVTDSLVKYNIPVVTGPVLRNPSRDSDKYDASYTNPGKMLAAGVKVAIKTDKYGSIEEGKVANLFIADGDPFEMKTTIQYLFIRGWKVPMESRHTLLHDEFLKRDPGLRQ